MVQKRPFMHHQRVLADQTPDQVVTERLTAKPALAKAKPSGRAGPGDIIKARLIAESAKEVSQPDSGRRMISAFNLGVPAVKQVPALHKHLAPVVREVAGIRRTVAPGLLARI